jgi:hypothetical protein
LRPTTSIHSEAKVKNRQKREIDSLVRVRTFLVEHPATGIVNYADTREVLDDVIQQVDVHAGAQALANELGRAAKRRQKEQIDRMFELHMRPIAAIARAQMEPGSDVGLPAGLRLPKFPLAPSRALAASHAMIEAARPFEALLISKGLAPDFLAQFAAAREALLNMRGDRETQMGRRVAAGAGLEAQLRRGRRAVTQLDAIVRAAFRGDSMTLSAWRGMRRIHLAPGGTGPVAVEGSSPITEAAA